LEGSKIDGRDAHLRGLLGFVDMRLFRSNRPSRLFILGLDGSPLPLLQRLMRAGDLPHLARAFETGTAVEMNSSLPDVSAVAWTSINTGKNPAKHGIYGFVDRRSGSNAMEIMTANHVQARTIWELVSDAGRRAIAINVPLSFPPQRINGVVVSDFLATSLPKAVHPPSLVPLLEDIGYRIDTDPAVARKSLDAFVEDFRITAEKRAEAVLHLMGSENWDLFMVVFMETDRLHHFMWQYMEEEDPTYGPKFLDCYRLVDALAGRIISRLSGDDQLIILSDHGFCTLKREVYLNAWLEQNGYLRFRPGGDRDLTGIDGSSRAFSLDPGRIYINLAGREPAGTVPAAEAPDLIDELVSQLEHLRDPDSGDAIVKAVYRADEVYRGPLRRRAPDLLVMPLDGYDIKGTFEPEQLTGRGKLVGMHKYDNATLFVRGKRMTVEHASVHDVLPTACDLLGIDCPGDVDGRVVAA
jgi:predicted AlkP superfamily phosphohydrolase/phosphomutase